MSDGTAYLRFLDKATQKETGRLQVRDGEAPVEELNELEYVKGEVFANVWHTHRIARISPKTGKVTGWIDLQGLLNPREAQGVDVLNGIAYDAAGDRLFVTGKLWPKIFEIAIVPKGCPEGTLRMRGSPRSGGARLDQHGAEAAQRSFERIARDAIDNRADGPQQQRHRSG